MGNNIILIGMPGVGKSTAGVVLAKMAGYHFLDSDLLIQEAEGRLLKDIIAMEGTEGLLRIEDRVNASIEADNTVIATGGSVVYCENAMAHLASIGTVVYLKASYDIIRKRLSNLKGRGVAIKEGQTLLDLYMERSSLYEKYASVTVEIDNMGIEATVCKILHSISQNM